MARAGMVPASGLRLRAEWSDMDAAVRRPEARPSPEPPGCQCGAVLRGFGAHRVSTVRAAHSSP